jgi:hypothetical protein
MNTLIKILSKFAHTRFVRWIRPSPMKKLIREITNTGFVSQWEAVELFARAGDWHTLDYFRQVSALDAWEIDPQWEESLHQNLPGAEIKITDTFDEIRSTSKLYNLVICDNSMALFADGKYCEHFELFPDVFRVLQDRAVLVLNVIPSVNKRWKAKFPYLMDRDHCSRRSKFYNTEQPETVLIEDMLPVYRDWAKKNGFRIEKNFSVKRHVIHYLALFLVKGGDFDD